MYVAVLLLSTNATTTTCPTEIRPNAVAAQSVPSRKRHIYVSFVLNKSKLYLMSTVSLHLSLHSHINHRKLKYSTLLALTTFPFDCIPSSLYTLLTIIIIMYHPCVPRHYYIFHYIILHNLLYDFMLYSKHKVFTFALLIYYTVQVEQYHSNVIMHLHACSFYSIPMYVILLCIM